jgi:CheY-like chemotaxis protein
MLLEYFKSSGNENYVKFMQNGKEAIKYLEQLCHDSLLPKLIVLDLNMPILNGTQTLINIKQNARFKNIPVIIYSTSANESEKRKCLNFGALDYVVKPSTYNEGFLMVEKFTAFILH